MSTVVYGLSKRGQVAHVVTLTETGRQFAMCRSAIDTLIWDKPIYRALCKHCLRIIESRL